MAKTIHNAHHFSYKIASFFHHKSHSHKTMSSFLSSGLISSKFLLHESSVVRWTKAVLGGARRSQVEAESGGGGMTGGGRWDFF